MTSIVLQEETTGCGFACVAMVAGKTYSEIKSLANDQGMFAEDEALSATTDYVRKLIGDLGIPLQPSEEKFRDWQSLPPLALLATKYRIENGTPSWHWCV